MIKVLLVVVKSEDVALDVELVILVDDDALVELDPFEVSILIEVVLLTELVEVLEVIAVIVESVAVDRDEDTVGLVRLLDPEGVITEEVSEPDFELVEDLELVDELVVLDFFEVVVLVVPSIQLQSCKSCGALKALNGDEVLVLFLV